MVEILAVLGLLGILAASVAPFLHGALPILALFQHFAAQLGAVSAIVLVVLLVLRLWRWSLLATLLTLWHAITVAPFIPLPGAEAAAAAPPLKVMSINLWYKNQDQDDAIRGLLASGADVIGTVETTAEWKQALQALETEYPYHVDCVLKVFRCGVAIYSKIPFKETFADRIDGKLPTIVSATIDWQGKPLTIAELQLINPLIGIAEDFQAQQAGIAGAYFAQARGPLVVMGDFNSAPWSRLQNDFRAATDLDNRGRLAFTWPSWAPVLFRLPIDQIFVKGGVVARNVRAGAPEGSDHLPIQADIYWEAQ